MHLGNTGLKLAIILVTCAVNARADVPPSTQPVFTSVEQLKDHYDLEIKESRKVIESARFNSLKLFLKTAPADEREKVFASIIITAKFLGYFDEIITFTDAFLAEYPSSADAWQVRATRFDALIETDKLAQARREWEKVSTDLDHWQQVFGTGMRVADGFADAGQVSEVKDIYGLLRKRLSFVSDLETILEPLSDGLFWVGRKPPVLEGKDLADKPVDLADFKGKVVLIDFWATWCGPCVASLPDLIQTYKEFHESGFEIIGINLDRDRGALESFLKRYNMPWLQIWSGKEYIDPNARKFNVTVMPSTFLIDRSGTIVRSGMPARGFGPVVKRLLAEPLPKKP